MHVPGVAMAVVAGRRPPQDRHTGLREL